LDFSNLAEKSVGMNFMLSGFVRADPPYPWAAAGGAWPDAAKIALARFAPVARAPSLVHSEQILVRSGWRHILSRLRHQLGGIGADYCAEV